MMRKTINLLSGLALVTSLFILNGNFARADSPTPAYNNIPNSIPGNVPSQGFECCSTKEIGDHIRLGETQRKAASATILMSNWAAGVTYPVLLAANPNGYTHAITLNIYQVGTPPNVGAKIASVTQNFLVPWLPQNDPTCPFQQGTVRKWRAPDGNCYNGIAFPITFNLTGIALPDEFIFGVAYNSHHHGYTPVGAAGPYDSLNVGTSDISPIVGTDIEPDAVYWNTTHGPFYADGGAAGVGVFRRDTGWTGYAIAATFNVLVPPPPPPPP
ncbi:MAG: hypothetical protein KIH69_020800, partial [Anaerolineae bacterium]|nr:hypothetical protein [Anaerolineae bacterium]